MLSELVIAGIVYRNRSWTYIIIYLWFRIVLSAPYKLKYLKDLLCVLLLVQNPLAMQTMVSDAVGGIWGRHNDN
jgi:hypothetical protein